MSIWASEGLVCTDPLRTVDISPGAHTDGYPWDYPPPLTYLYKKKKTRRWFFKLVSLRHGMVICWAPCDMRVQYNAVLDGVEDSAMGGQFGGRVIRQKSLFLDTSQYPHQTDLTWRCTVFNSQARRAGLSPIPWYSSYRISRACNNKALVGQCCAPQ